MSLKHPQERVVETFCHQGIEVELVEWEDTTWCGKIGYAINNTDEPDVDAIMEAYMALDQSAAKGRESDWSACISLNYLCNQRPNGVMFGCLAADEKQPKDFDVYKIPAAQYMRIRMCDETAKALGHALWQGGIPPYQWIGEEIAPELGYKYGDDTLPVIEYYGYYDPDKHAHELLYLYVPVQRI